MNKIEKNVRAQDWLRNPAADDWRDGMLSGNGLLGVMASADDALDFIVNANDVYDSNNFSLGYLRHSEVLEKMFAGSERSVRFLDKEEQRLPVFNNDESQVKTITPARLRIRFGYGIGWCAPANPLFKQRLSLYDGVMHTTGDSHLFHVASEHFVPRDRRLFALKMRNNGTAETNKYALERPAVVELFRPENPYMELPGWQVVDPYTLLFTQKYTEKPNGAGNGSYAVALRVVSKDGKGMFSSTGALGLAGKISLNGLDFDLYLAVASTYSGVADPASAVLAEITEAQTLGIDYLQEENARWWSDYWQKSYACFGGEKDMQRYFTFSLYEIGSTFGGVPMVGLNGFAYGPLNSMDYGVSYAGYTHDQNAQMPFMPCLMLNHLEYFDHVADTYLRVLPELKQHTSSVYERPGVAIPLGMNQEGAAAACLSYRYTLCGSAYTGWLLAMRWRFCRDEEYFQRRMRPLLREFAEFYLASFSRVSDAPDAEYVLDWSVPPEIFSMTRNDNATLALLKTMLNIFVEACEFYGCEKALTARCRDLLAHYPALCKRPDGAWWCGPDIPLDHYMWCGHLCYPFFPSEADTDVRAAMATVNYMDNRGVERSYADPEIEFHLNHDWAWCLNVVSRQRCGDVEKSWAELGRFIRYFGKENGLFSHNPVIITDVARMEEKIRSVVPQKDKDCDGSEMVSMLNDGQSVTGNPRAKKLSPAVVEGNSIFALAASEALLQSWGGVIRLFPAVKAGFSGWFKNFLVPPGIEVSAEMRKGKLISCRMRAKYDCSCRVQLPGGEIGEYSFKAGETRRLV